MLLPLGIANTHSHRITLHHTTPHHITSRVSRVSPIGKQHACGLTTRESRRRLLCPNDAAGDVSSGTTWRSGSGSGSGSRSSSSKRRGGQWHYQRHQQERRRQHMAGITVLLPLPVAPLQFPLRRQGYFSRHRGGTNTMGG